MTTPFRSAFYGSSGFVAARSAVRVVEVSRQDQRPALRPTDREPVRQAVTVEVKSPEALAA